MYTVGKSCGTSSRLLCQCTCQGHSSSTVSMCLVAELMLAATQVNADDNAERFEGRQIGQDSIHYEYRKLAETVCMSTDDELSRTSLEGARGSCLRLLPPHLCCND